MPADDAGCHLHGLIDGDFSFEADVQFTGEGVSGTPLLAVDTSAGELLVPLAEDICLRVDTRGRRIDVVLPEGLRDLNP